jgi:hypothetical protein
MDYTALITQVGFPSVILYICIKEFFSYLKSRKPEGQKTEYNSEAILEQLTKMNDNHLSHVESAIRDGNKEIVAAINAGNIKMVELLGEIKGNLQK